MITSSGPESIASPVRSSKAIWLKNIRQLHMYLGVFFAPAILFFSFTGALQLFGLHEGHPGEAYQAPKWIAMLASIHKDQVLSQHHGPPPGIGDRREGESPDSSMRGREPQKDEEHHEGKATLVLKWFFLAMAIGLSITTLLGIYMAFKYNRSRAITWSLLIAGAGIPTALITLLG